MKKCTPILPSQVKTDNVLYSGDHLPFLNINTNDQLTGILVKIDAALAILSGTTYDLINAGTPTSTGNGTSLSFTFPHGLGATPSGISVVAMSTGSQQTFKTSFDSTNITVSYSLAPSSGEQLTWAFIAVKNN